MPKADPNDISRFRPPVHSGVLQSVAEPKSGEIADEKIREVKLSRTTKKRKVKPPRRNQINFYLTDEENEKFFKKAGMVPASKFVVAKLREAGLFD